MMCAVKNTHKKQPLTRKNRLKFERKRQKETSAGSQIDVEYKLLEQRRTLFYFMD